MSRTHTFGIVGGYGATGSAVAAELLKSAVGNILVGGRDPNKASALAAHLGSRLSAAQLDVLDSRSLDDFCSLCSIVINCAGPVSVLQDRVAQAAFRSRSHYVDVAGLSFVKQRMSPHAHQIADLGLFFVVSAGWNPGISELVPAYAHAVARTKMDTIESLSVYFTDSGEWSDNALRDGVWFLRDSGLPKPGYFRKGQRMPVRMSAASRIVDLVEPIGRRRFSLVSVPELDELGARFTDCDVFIYAYLSGARTALAAMLMALVPLPDRVGVHLFRNIFRRNRLPVDGFAAAHVVGESQGRKVTFTAQISYRDRRDYWINALVPATVARLISQANSDSSLGDSVHPQANSAGSQANSAQSQPNPTTSNRTFISSEARPLPLGAPSAPRNLSSCFRPPVARLISQTNSVRPGLHYLSDAVDPIAFMSTLKHSGVSQSESLHWLE